MIKKIVTIIGARPQIIKAAAISRAISGAYSNQLQEVIVHTGQHYDQDMSGVFFDELNIPKPNYNLHVGSGTHGVQTGNMLIKIEEVLLHEKPSAVLVYGDTNSTLAAALAASKLHIPVVHVEAGLRSYNKSMPEEINRIACDHVSTLLFSPTESGVQNLLKEGFSLPDDGPFHADHPGVFISGDVMYDNSKHFSHVAASASHILEQFDLKKDHYVLATIHRDHNTDVPQRLNAIFEALLSIVMEHRLKVLLPLHPRTSKMLQQHLSKDLAIRISATPELMIIPPASFLDMIQLESHARFIITDSGGVQKEAFFFKKPCIILRPQTEWIELVENGNAQIADADPKRIAAFADYYLSNPELTWPAFYGTGHAADFICKKMVELLQ